MVQRRAKFNFVATVAIMTAPVAAVVEIGTVAAGHELTWFGRLSQGQAAWVRMVLIAAACAAAIIAVALRGRRDAV